MKAETKTVGMNVHKEDWEDKSRAEYLRRLLDNSLRSEIFDEIMKGGRKIITVSELRTHIQNSVNMVDIRRYINIEEVVCCADCKHFNGDGLECRWGMYVYEDDYCSHGERREFDGRC